MAAVTALPARPGIFLYEDTAGPTPAVIATYSRVYYLGSSTLGDDLEAVPTVLGSLDDFTNLFGSSSAINLNNLTAYFTNLRRGLYFVKVKPAPMATVTVVTNAAGTYNLVVAGVSIDTVIPASPTPTAAIVINAIINQINNNTSINLLVEAEPNLDNTGTPTYSPATFRLRSKDGNAFTLTTIDAKLTASTVTTPTTLNYWDYFSALDRLEQSSAEEPLGFLVCPEAFYSLTNQYQRTVVGNYMEGVARSLGWMALLDPGAPSTITTPIQAKSDASGYNAVRGHAAYYYPYLTDVDSDDVSPSVMVAGFALQRYESQGIHQPPAGSLYPFRGIGGIQYKLSNAQRDDLAQNRINAVIYKTGVGYIPFDTLTRSTDPNFKMINVRVVMSCIERTIQDTLDASGLLFSAIGSRGIFYLKLKSTIEGVLNRFYVGDALYGARPEDAYSVRCDASTQINTDLEAGIVNAEIYCVPAATARQIRAVVFRVQIGSMGQALLQAAA